MPSDVFLDSSSGGPVAQCLQAHCVRRQGKDKLSFVAVLRLTHEIEMSIAQRYVDPTCRTVPGSLRLIEAKKPIRKINLRESQVFDITEAQSGIKTEQKCPAYIGILVWVMRHRKLLDFVHREDVFLDLLAVNFDNYAIARIPQEDFVFGCLLEHFLESLEQGVRLSLIHI